MSKQLIFCIVTKKYELTRNTYQHFEFRLYQIRALCNFGNIKAGQLGGYVSGYHNLSQNGDCWIYDNALVYLDALVADDAQVKGTCWVFNNAKVYENATVKDGCFVQANAEVFGKAIVENDAFVSGSCKIYENCHVAERAGVWGRAWCHGNSKIYGFAQLYGNIEVTGTAKIRGQAELWEGLFNSGCQESANHRMSNIAS